MNKEFREKCRGLNKASLSKDFLQTNSTTHNFLFGAVAELVDNSKDAGARNLSIDYEVYNGTPCLIIKDDGRGMSPIELKKVINYGYSNKNYREDKIGQYGNGLKSGAMRVAGDCLLLTKHEESQSMSALLLSKTFLNDLGYDEILVPMPSFKLNENTAFDEDSSLFGVENEILMKYTPCSVYNNLMDMFARIPRSGTMVILFNLRHDDTGTFELDFETDPHDILMKDDDLIEEEQSLRKYLSILYFHPTMRINLRGQDVVSRRLVSEMHLAASYTYFPKRINGVFETQQKRLRDQLEQLYARRSEALDEQGKFQGNMPRPVGENLRAYHTQLNLRQKKVRDILDQIEEVKKLQGELKPGHRVGLPVFYGLNIVDRSKDGMMLYNNGRLIEMYIQPRTNALSGMTIVADIPYSIMLPTHNKQAFENQKDRNAVVKQLFSHVDRHKTKKMVDFMKSPGSLWDTIGYKNSSPTTKPHLTAEVVKRIHGHIGQALHCAECHKWRKIRGNMAMVAEEHVSSWTCSMHPDPSKRFCHKPESLKDLNPPNSGTMDLAKQTRPRRSRSREKDTASVEELQLLPEEEEPARTLARREVAPREAPARRPAPREEPSAERLLHREDPPARHAPRLEVPMGRRSGPREYPQARHAPRLEVPTGRLSGPREYPQARDAPRLEVPMGRRPRPHVEAPTRQAATHDQKSLVKRAVTPEEEPARESPARRPAPQWETSEVQELLDLEATLDEPLADFPEISRSPPRSRQPAQSEERQRKSAILSSVAQRAALEDAPKVTPNAVPPPISPVRALSGPSKRTSVVPPQPRPPPVPEKRARLEESDDGDSSSSRSTSAPSTPRSFNLQMKEETDEEVPSNTETVTLMGDQVPSRFLTSLDQVLREIISHNGHNFMPNYNGANFSSSAVDFEQMFNSLHRGQPKDEHQDPQ